MKRAIALVILLTMVLGFGNAWAEQATLSPSLTDEKVLEKFASFAETGDVYTVRSFEADTALRQLTTTSSGAMIFFTVELTGVKALGIVQPVLTIYYRGGEAVNARAVALALGDTRYVLAAASKVSRINRKSVEVITAPLTKEAYAVLSTLDQGSTLQLRLLGDKVYTTTIAGSAKTLAAQSLTCSKAIMEALDALPMSDYSLWDLSASWYENLNGFEPMMTVDALPALEESGIQYDAMGMLVYGNRNVSVKNARQLLIDRGFMVATEAQGFGDEMMTAVLSAQRYYGLMETGCINGALVACLTGAQLSQPAQAQQSTLSEVAMARVSISRAWFAKGVAPSIPQDGGVIKPLNGDNRLLIADGVLESIAPTELRLYRDMTAAFVCGDTRFEATLVCEVDGGKAFSTDVLPLSAARLVAYAEIPEAAALKTGWQLEIACGDTSATWPVQ